MVNWSCGGAPVKLSDDNVEEIEKIINEYFEGKEENELLVTGLALALDVDRHTLLEYGNGNRDDKSPRVACLIKKAYKRIHASYEGDLRKKARSGDIFALKNFGWTDKKEIEATVTGIGVLLEALDDDEDTQDELD